MRHQSRLAVFAAAVVGASAGIVRAEQLLSPNDFIIAIDGTADSASFFPTNENPTGAFDNDATTKYLNFARRGSGVIVTTGASTIQSFQLFTANDAQERDPATYLLFGTNDAIQSANNSNGLGGETWTLLSQGALAPPNTGGPLNDGRQAPYPAVNLTNSTSYSSYKMYFPKMRDSGVANSMQISEIHFFDAPDAGGNQILPQTFDNTSIRAIDHPQSDSAYQFAGRPQLAIDGNLAPAAGAGRYQNRLYNGGVPTGGVTTPVSSAGLIITPTRGLSVIKSFQILTSSDQPTRDPTSYELYGTSAPIVDEDNSDGLGESWTLISSGSLGINATRNAFLPTIDLSSNSASYLSYKILFPANNGNVNFLQVGEVLFDGILLGEPEWANNSSGDWNNPGNWIGTLPNGVDKVARFLSKSTSPHTVFTDTAVTVGKIQFNNSATYVVAGNGSLAMQVTSGSATIDVVAGSHKINLPLFINSNTNVTVAAGASLTIGNPTVVSAGKVMTNSGVVTVQAPLSIAAGGAVAVKSGQTTLSGVPTLADGAKVDVMKDGQLVVKYQGGATPADAVKAQLIAGYNGGDWNAEGITTSSAIAGKTGLGWKDDAANQAVTVKYTWYGDTNLDGRVDVTDLGALATSWQTHNVWSGGDFNYDGLVDVTDLGALANNWQAGVRQGAGTASLDAALAAVGLGGVSVPEPASAGTLLMLGFAAAAAAAAARRTRRARS